MAEASDDADQFEFSVSAEIRKMTSAQGSEQRRVGSRQVVFVLVVQLQFAMLIQQFTT